MLFRSLRENRSTADIPVIFLSAWADRQNVREGMQLGAADYITKPFRVEEVTAAIETQAKAVRQRQSHIAADCAEARLGLVRKLPHELLTPLNGILGPAEMLKMADCPLSKDEVSELGHAIFLSARRLQRVMENLLLHIDSLEKRRPLPSPHSSVGADALRRAIDEAVSAICEVTGSSPKRIRIMGDMPAAAIRGEDLKKVVLELLENALKFSPEDSCVDLHVGQIGTELRIAVRDFGRGMTSTQIAEVSAFSQFERERFEQQGLGLGLTICRNIASSYGGTLDIQSIEGGPTTVRCSFPVTGS